jgi:hypothetical protein
MTEIFVAADKKVLTTFTDTFFVKKHTYLTPGENR